MNIKFYNIEITVIYVIINEDRYYTCYYILLSIVEDKVIHVIINEVEF